MGKWGNVKYCRRFSDFHPGCDRGKLSKQEK